MMKTFSILLMLCWLLPSSPVAVDKKGDDAALRTAPILRGSRF